MSRQAEKAAILRMREYLAFKANPTEEEDRDFRASKARAMHDDDLRRNPQPQLELKEAA